jgi:hypothetical protein
VKRYCKYERNASWIVKWYGKYGKKYWYFCHIFHIISHFTYFSSIFSISFHYPICLFSLFFISFHYPSCLFSVFSISFHYFLSYFS